MTAYITSLRQLCLKMLPSNVTARSLTMHYENVDLNQRKDDASDDSSISSENEGIGISLPVKYPDLTAKQMVRRIQRWYRRQKGTYLPQHYHKNPIPILDGPRMLRKVESRMRSAEAERTDDLPSRRDIPARQEVQPIMRVSLTVAE